MATDTQPVAPSKALWWIGCVLSLLVIGLMAVGGGYSIAKPDFVDAEMAKRGWPAGLAIPLGVTELLCALLYAIPQTAVLGAVLLTGYLGGAVATHVQAGENFIMAVAVGVVVWLGLFLRDPRVRALLPWRGN